MTHRTSRGSGDPILLAVIGVAVLVVGFIVFTLINALHVQEHQGCVVTDKDRTTKVTSDGNGGTTSRSDARVYTENCGTFVVADSLLSWTWSSADTYASIKVGETYDFTTRGFRIPFFSAFPNIVEANPVQEDK